MNGICWKIILDRLQMRTARQAERADEQQRAERDGRPVKHDAPDPVAARA